MNPLSDLIDRLRGLDLERMAGLRPAYPPVAVEMDRNEMVLVRLKRRRRGQPTLEAHQVRPMPEQAGAGSILRPNLVSPQEVAKRVRELLETSGTRPGRISLILPDNLAKVSLLSLPERPASRKQLEEIVRFKVRRSVPFRLDEAAWSYQLLPGENGGIHVLVVLLRRGVVEQYEKVFESVGARVGLFDLCTPNLFNLCRAKIVATAKAGVDAALLNCTPSYFSLLIVRGERLIFYRCKSYAVTDDAAQGHNGVMARELASSLSYYEEKLSGQGIGTVYLRSVAEPFEEVEGLLGKLGIERVERVDPAGSLELVEGLRLDPDVGQRIAPAVGAAAGRS